MRLSVFFAHTNLKKQVRNCKGPQVNLGQLGASFDYLKQDCVKKVIIAHGRKI